MVPAPMGVTVGRPVLGRGGTLSFPRPAVYGGPGPYVYDAQSARHIPAVGRALGLYAGLCKQMPMESFRGYGRIEPTPRILARPDPLNGGPWFVQVNVEDYLLNGNALSLVTNRGADGWPLSVMWLPVNYVTVSYDPTTGVTTYDYLGEPLPADDVIHVKRGADRNYPVRGIGVVEEYLATLDRVAMEEEYEHGRVGQRGGSLGRRHYATANVEPGRRGRGEGVMDGQVWRAGTRTRDPSERNRCPTSRLVAYRYPVGRGPPYVVGRRGEHV